MRRFFRELLYDIREMGIHFWAAVSGCLIIVPVLLLLRIYIGSQEQLLVTMLPVMQLLISLSYGYIAVLIMQGLLDTEGGELGFSFSRSYLYWGIIRELRITAVMLIVTVAVCIPCSLYMAINCIHLAAMLSLQGIAAQGVAFLGVAVSRKVSVGLIILIAFIGIQATLGQEYEIFNLIYLPFQLFPDDMHINRIIFNSAVTGICGLGLGQTWIRPR